MENINDKLGNNIGGILNEELQMEIKFVLYFKITPHFRVINSRLATHLMEEINNQLKQEKFPDEEHNI